MKRGFTLVELAIVLVIIGLLIGGILAAQSMIRSASLSKTISLIQQFDAFAVNYYSTYKYLPGDNPNDPPNDGILGGWGACGSSSSNSLGDGIIDAGCFVGTNVAGHYYGGIKQFWYLLSNRQLYSPGTVPPYTYWSSGSRQNAYPAPIAKSGSNTGFWVGCVGAGNNCSVGSPENYYAIMQTYEPYGDGTYAISTIPAVLSSNAYALDKKLDDGIADSGSILSGNGSGGVNKTSVGANCSTGADYNLSYTDYACIPIIKLGSQVKGVIQ